MKKTSELWNFYIKELKRCIVEFKDKKTRKKQIANILTAIRLLAPIVILPLAFFKLYVPTIILTILFALTDTFDGYFARKYNAVTNFGKDLDAIVDKIFAATILIAISFINIWLLILVLMEAVIALINVVEKYKNNKPMTIIIGKFKTIVLSLLIIIFLANLYIEIPKIILISIYVLTLLLQITTALFYFDRFLKNNYNRKIKLIPKETNGPVMTKLNNILLHKENKDD